MGDLAGGGLEVGGLEGVNWMIDLVTVALEPAGFFEGSDGASIFLAGSGIETEGLGIQGADEVSSGGGGISEVEACGSEESRLADNLCLLGASFLYSERSFE